MGNSRNHNSTGAQQSVQSRKSIFKWFALVCFGFLVISSSSGCFHTPHRFGDRAFSRAFTNWRNYVWAKRAYHMQYGNCDVPCADDFRNGFIAGYCNVCDGKDGYVPALPPEQYWDSRYQTADGQKRTKMWFAGFPAGAKAARATGAGAFTEIPISNMLDKAIQDDVKAGKDGIGTEPVKSKDAAYSSQPIPVYEVEWDSSLER